LEAAGEKKPPGLPAVSGGAVLFQGSGLDLSSAGAVREPKVAKEKHGQMHGCGLYHGRAQPSVAFVSGREARSCAT
jgi:hypothetical protein